MVKLALLESWLTGAGFWTTTLTVPPRVRLPAGTCAVSLVLEAKVVASGAPFQLSTAPDTKLVPVMVNWNPAVSALAAMGCSAVSVGARCWMPAASPC